MIRATLIYWLTNQSQRMIVNSNLHRPSKRRPFPNLPTQQAFILAPRALVYPHPRGNCLQAVGLTAYGHLQPPHFCRSRSFDHYRRALERTDQLGGPRPGPISKGMPGVGNPNLNRSPSQCNRLARQVRDIKNCARNTRICLHPLGMMQRRVRSHRPCLNGNQAYQGQDHQAAENKQYSASPHLRSTSPTNRDIKPSTHRNPCPQIY